MGLNKNKKVKSLSRDNLGVYLDYSREKRIEELLDARNECIEEIEILMKQMSKKLRKKDLRLRAKRSARMNYIITK